MRDWNVVITVMEHEYRAARASLEAFGPVSRTEFYNVLVMNVGDTTRFTEELAQAAAADPGIFKAIHRVVPATVVFNFQSAEEFEQQASEAVAPWVPLLAGRRFHVRMHRRGFKGRISSEYEEKFLDHHVHERLAGTGEQAEVDFEDPDYIIAVEMVAQRAGLSIWAREALHRYPFLGLD